MERIRIVGILGAGQMGAGIAQVAAQAGFEVLLTDASLELAARAKTKILAMLGKQVDKGKLPSEERDAIGARITPVGGVSDLASSDLAIEAVSENVAVKLDLFRKLDAAVKPDGYLASNTSSISVTKIAAETKRPDRVIGMHFMNPPPLMKLVEIVRALQTSDETWSLIKATAERMGKTVVTSKDSPGFLVNRMLIPVLAEACFALQDGLGSAEDIDTAAKLGLNHPMGPLELADLIGLDTMLAISEVFQREFGDDKYRAPTLLRNLVAAGWYGRKSGRGFYTYDDQGKRLGPSLSPAGIR